VNKGQRLKQKRDRKKLERAKEWKFQTVLDQPTKFALHKLVTNFKRIS